MAGLTISLQGEIYMATKCKINYLLFKVRGRIIKIDPDIYYKIFNPGHELPYRKYNGDISTIRICGEDYPMIVRRTETKALKQTVLSRFIMDAKEGQIVDHINRNPRDNRRSNLRIVTHRQNSLNKRCKSATGFIGVYIWRKKGKSYCRAQFLNSNGKKRSFQLEDSPENRIIAAFVRDKFVLAAGEEDYAPLNFPCFKNEPFRSYLLEEDFSKYRKKSEARNPKFETNPNYQNSNYLNAPRHRSGG
jgi:hypothetical protein